MKTLDIISDPIAVVKLNMSQSLEFPRLFHQPLIAKIVSQDQDLCIGTGFDQKTPGPRTLNAQSNDGGKCDSGSRKRHLQRGEVDTLAVYNLGQLL